MINEANYHMSNSYFSAPLLFGETKLLQIGRLYCNAGLVVQRHEHPVLYEITAVTSGKGILYTNNVPIEIQEGDVYLSLPFDIHEIISDVDEPLQYDFLAFTTENTYSISTEIIVFINK
jgi:quercetin dioxygenase-like cupin family protein